MLDWYHRDYVDIIDEMLAPGGSPKVVSDNNLINGKMNFDCSTVAAGDKTKCTNGAGISKFRFQTGKTHRLRLINSGSDGVQRFTIDEHTMTVIALDFDPVKPYNTTVVTLGVGQRADVLVTANAGSNKSAYWMRSNNTCTLHRQPNAVAAVYYDKADTSRPPTSQAWDLPALSEGCVEDPLTVTEPLFPIALPEETYVETMAIELYTNASGVTLWKFDGVSMRADYSRPVLLLADRGNLSYPEEWNVRNYWTNSSVRVVINNRTPGSYVLFPPFSIFPPS